MSDTFNQSNRAACGCVVTATMVPIKGKEKNLQININLCPVHEHAHEMRDTLLMVSRLELLPTDAQAAVDDLLAKVTG